jgi:cytoskeletal protein CcmA (bactofilin family)
MAFFKDSSPGTRDPFASGTTPTSSPPPAEAARTPEPAAESARKPVERGETRAEAPAPRVESKESFISAELTLEGKIEGSGNVRVAGRFKGDVNVQGDLTIEKGAQISGQVHARQVVVEGMLEGNIVSAERVELRATGVLNGDVKAGALIVAAGSKMRGNAEFGWEGAAVPAKPSIRGVG